MSTPAGFFYTLSVRQDIETTWMEDLSARQRERLRWLRDHKCRFEAARVLAAPQGDRPETFLLEVFLDNYAVVRERGEDVAEVFDRAVGQMGALLRFETDGNVE